MIFSQGRVDALEFLFATGWEAGEGIVHPEFVVFDAVYYVVCMYLVLCDLLVYSAVGCPLGIPSGVVVVEVTGHVYIRLTYMFGEKGVVLCV